jgi:hypothetical protein
MSDAQKEFLAKMYPHGGRQKKEMEQQVEAENEKRKEEQREQSLKGAGFGLMVLFGAPVGFIFLALLWKGIKVLFSMP